MATNTPLRLFAGDDKLLMQAMEYGAVGAISAAAHIRPDLYVRIYRLIQEGKHLEALQLFNILLPLIRLLFQEPSPGPIKALLAYQGHIQEELRLPMTPVSIHHRNELIKAFDRLNSQTA